MGSEWFCRVMVSSFWDEHNWSKICSTSSTCFDMLSITTDTADTLLVKFGVHLWWLIARCHHFGPFDGPKTRFITCSYELLAVNMTFQKDEGLGDSSRFEWFNMCKKSVPWIFGSSTHWTRHLNFTKRMQLIVPWPYQLQIASLGVCHWFPNTTRKSTHGWDGICYI